MKYVLVTGGTRGIGLAIAEKFYREGYMVYASYASDEAGAKRAKELLPGATFIKADVQNENAVISLMKELPHLDVLVNNAGVSLYSLVQDTAVSDWERVVGVNARGCFLTVKHAVKKFLERGAGAIINIASVWGETGASFESVYSASKGAVIAFTKSMAKELAPSAICVNCVSPGVIDTAMNAHLSTDERAALCEQIPLGRFGGADEVAQAVYFLANQTYITGQTLTVDGGFTI